MVGAQEGRLARWAARLSEYSLEIYWKSGKELVAVDCLSRMVEPREEIEDRMVYSVAAGGDVPQDFPTMEDILDSQKRYSMPPGIGYCKKGGAIFYLDGL